MPPSMLTNSLISDDSRSREMSSSEAAQAADNSMSSSYGDGNGKFDSDDSFSDDEPISEAMLFLGAKQSLLQRAAQVMRQEEAYNAANAYNEATPPPNNQQKRDTAAGSESPSSPLSPSDESSHDDEEIDLWTEARDYLISMQTPEDAPLACEQNAAPYRKRCLPNPSHPLIDMSRVHKVMSKFYVESVPCEDTQFVTTLPSTVFGKGQVSLEGRFGVLC
jgi:hypothetical protein